MSIKHYEVQTDTWAEGWVNTWGEDDKPRVFQREMDANRAIIQFFDDLPEEMRKNYNMSAYRVQAIHWDDLLTISEGETMAQIATNLQAAISTPELRDLIDALADLYEPTDDMLNDAKYDNAHGSRAWPDCFRFTV